MYNKNIILFIILCFPALMGMESSLLFSKKLPGEIAEQIKNYAQSPQWWYLDSEFYSSDKAINVALNSHDKLLATMGCFTIALFDLQKNIRLASWGYPNKFNYSSYIYFSKDGTKIVITSRDYDFEEKFDIQEYITITPSKNEADYSYSHPTFGSIDSNCDLNNKTENPHHHIEEKIRNVFAVNSICHDHKIPLTVTGCDDYNVRIFALHATDTIDQRILKGALNRWLLIEKPNKDITMGALLKDVALKCFDSYLHITPKLLIKTLKTFPESIRYPLRRTLNYKIQKYGKSKNNSYCPMQ